MRNITQHTIKHITIKRKNNTEHTKYINLCNTKYFTSDYKYNQNKHINTSNT